MSLVERSFVGLVGLVMVLLGGGKDVPNVAPEFGSEACGRVVVGLVVELAVRVAVADLGIGTLGSRPLLSVGEPVSRQNLLSRFVNVPMTGCSNFVLVPPLPEHELEEGKCGCSW